MSTPLNEAETIVDAALDLAPTGRAAYLDKVCGDNVALRQTVEALLRAHVHAPAPHSPATLVVVPPPAEQAGDKFGPYKLLQRLGEGGCGVVYMAEQESPVRRRVALKVIKLGMDTKQIIARFEAERQTLALMDHPNIAKVLEAGASENGRPYFVMELVKGVRITDYCDQNHLSTRERLGLFTQVCQAIQHAHQKGIIHRDIKPSNILVTLHDGVPVPKVIDFGIAKATEQPLTEKTVFTALGQFMGTPAYMSPEQAELSGLDVDTRSDIYALGVLLYELLTGKTPFDGKELLQAGVDEMRRRIREEEPLRPSTRLSTMANADLTVIAERRRAEPGKLPRFIRGDLDWIVMKCLEKDRNRRYETANGLAMDLRRHLNNEPVVACPPSAAYKFRKAFRRNKPMFASGTAVVTVLLLGIVASTWQSRQATRAKQEALSARQRSETNEKKAIEAQSNEAKQLELADAARANEATLRIKAQADELAARRRAYAADMLLCQQDLAGNNLRRARLLLQRQRPVVGEEDLRGWEWRYLWQRCRGDALLKLNTRGRLALAAKFIDAGNTLSTYVVSSRVSLWNLATKQEDVLCEEFGGWINNSALLSVSADEKWIAAAGQSPTNGSVIHIWEKTQRTMVSELTIGNGLIAALTLSPDKQWLAVCLVREPRLVYAVYNVRTKQRVIEFPSPSHANPGGAVAFSPDGEVLAMCDGGGGVRLVEVRNWKEKTVLPGGFPAGDVIALAYSPDGRFLAAGSQYSNPRILVWDTERDKKIATLSGHRGYITCLAFSPDGKVLASASADQTIKLWNSDTWKDEDTLIGHTDEVWSVAFSSNGKRLVSAGKDGYFCVWRTTGNREDRGSLVLPGEIHSPDASSDGKHLVGISGDGTVRLLERATLREKDVPPELGSNNVAAFWVSPREILIGSQRPLQLKTWSLSDNTITKYSPGTADDQVTRFNYLPGHHLLALTSVSPTTGNVIMNIWNALSHQEHSSRMFDEMLKGLGYFTLSNDGEWVAIPGSRGLSVWNIRAGNEKLVFQARINLLQGLAMLSKPPRIVNGSQGAPAMSVWDIVTGKKMLSLEGHNQVIGDIAVSPDEERLVTSTIGREPIRFWDTKSWNELLDIEGATDCSLSIPRFLSDGNTLAAVEVNLESGAKHVRLWRAPSWAEIHAAEAEDR